jgi:hypothetical protein
VGKNKAKEWLKALTPLSAALAAVASITVPIILNACSQNSTADSAAQAQRSSAYSSFATQATVSEGSILNSYENTIYALKPGKVNFEKLVNYYGRLEYNSTTQLRVANEQLKRIAPADIVNSAQAVVKSLSVLETTYVTELEEPTFGFLQKISTDITAYEKAMARFNRLSGSP